MDNELKHYRTPGSKNGVRLYQNKDGSLTLLGKKRYLKGEQIGHKQYYESGYKPKWYDVYGKEKQTELKKWVNKNGGNKNYKGYERAESKELKRSDPHKIDVKRKPVLKLNLTEIIGAQAIKNASNAKKVIKRKAIDITDKVFHEPHMQEPEVFYYIDEAKNKQFINLINNKEAIDTGKDFIESVFLGGSSKPEILFYNSIAWLIKHNKKEKKGD